MINIAGSDQETISFSKAVKATGNIEDWLGAVEKGMQVMQPNTPNKEKGIKPGEPSAEWDQIALPKLKSPSIRGGLHSAAYNMLMAFNPDFLVVYHSMEVSGKLSRRYIKHQNAFMLAGEEF